MTPTRTLLTAALLLASASAYAQPATPPAPPPSTQRMAPDLQACEGHVTQLMTAWEGSDAALVRAFDGLLDERGKVADLQAQLDKANARIKTLEADAPKSGTAPAEAAPVSPPGAAPVHLPPATAKP